MLTQTADVHTDDDTRFKDTWTNIIFNMIYEHKKLKWLKKKLFNIYICVFALKLQ